MNQLITFMLLFPLFSFATLNDVDMQQIWSKNIMTNGGFENGKAHWTASGGTFALATSGNNLLSGKVSGTWDSDGANQTLTYTPIVIPKGLYGRNGVVSCKVMGPSGNVGIIPYVTDGTNTLVRDFFVIGASPTRVTMNFIFPSSGSLYFRLESDTAGEPLLVVDDCFIGDASEVNLTNISQAQFVGSAYIPVTASCAPTRANTSIGAFGADADCPGPTVELNPGPGTIQTTDANGPSFTVNNLPPGTYRVLIRTGGQMSGASAGSNFAINDGTNTYGEQVGGPHTTATRGVINVEATFTYTVSGNRTFVLYGKSTAGTITLDMDAVITYFSIYRFPLSSEQAYRPDASAMSWSGYHASDCSWARTNTAYGDPTADATCTFTEVTNSNFGTVTSADSGGSKLPGITFTPPRAGRYNVCVNFQIAGSVNLQKVAVLDGSTEVAYAVNSTSANNGQAGTCAVITATSVAAKTVKLQTASPTGSVTLGPASTTTANVMWSIFAIDQQLPAPLLVNSVVSPSSGVERIVRAVIEYSAGTPQVRSQSGSWISSITDSGTGRPDLNIAASTFSAAPTCSCTTEWNSSGQHCQINEAPTSSVVKVLTSSSTPSAFDHNFHIICVGPK